MTYQPGVPTGSIPLNQDYLNIENNFTQLDAQWRVDHTPLTSTSGNPPNGYHTSIHLVPQTNPIPVTGYGQVYNQTLNDGINTDQTLFFLTGNGLNLQLTRNFLPVNNVNGYTFLPGGLIMQWGRENGPFVGGSNGVVTFTQAFPKNCFGVWMNLQYDSSPPSSSGVGTIIYDQSLLSPTSFKWFLLTNSSKYTRFFWVAIGK